MSRVAVIGASKNRAKFGNKAVRAYESQGHEVFPVHPFESEIEGLICSASILNISGDVEIVSVYVPPEKLFEILPEIAEKGCQELWLNPGTESEKVIERAEALGLNVIDECSIVGLGLSPSMF